MTQQCIKLSLLVFASILVTSCKTQLNEPRPQLAEKQGSQVENDRIICFSSREQLEEVLKKEDISSLKTIPSNFLTLKASDIDQESQLEDLVPDVTLRNLLSKRGEVIIADTLYIITEKGTFFSKTKFKDELLALTNKDIDLATTEQIEEKLYKLGNVYLYDTFGKHTDSTQDSSGDESTLNTSTEKAEETELGNLRSGNIPTPDLKTLQSVRGSRQTIFGKFFQGLGIRKSFVKTLTGVRNRRLNCAVFDYNYFFRQSVGITAKIQKKMWYGAWVKAPSWGKEDLRIGFESVIVRFPYPENSTYGDIFQRAFPDRDVNNINITYGKPWLHTKPRKWASSMQANGHIEVDLDFFPMIELRTPSVADIATAASRYLYTIMKDLSRRNNIYVDFESMDPFSPIPRNKRTNNIYEIMKERNVYVPVFAQDGIYIYFPYGEIRNTSSQSEITHRFAEAYLTNFKLSFSGTIDDLSNINSLYKHLKPWGTNPDVKLIQGNFYACAYSDKWFGYTLYW